MVKEDRSEVIEQGDIFFFYRPKVDAEEVENIKDVQRTKPSYLIGQENINQKSKRQNK
jgi:hypothetical protein